MPVATMPSNKSRILLDSQETRHCFYKQANLERKRELLRILLLDLTVSPENLSVELKTPFNMIVLTAFAACGGPHRRT